MFHVFYNSSIKIHSKLTVTISCNPPQFYFVQVLSLSSLALQFLICEGKYKKICQAYMQSGIALSAKTNLSFLLIPDTLWVYKGQCNH